MNGPWEQLADLFDRPVPAWAAAGAAALSAVAVAVLLLAVARRGRPARAGRGHRLETVLTVAAAGIATGVSASGMWQVFGDALHMSGPARVAAFAFLEVALAVSAIRARRALRETGSTGVDGAAVWVLAGLTAVLSALDADGPAAVLLRLAAPLVAAWLWERGLAPDRRQGQVRRRRGPVAWRVTRERVLVWLRLAEPAERAVAEVERARKVARLTRAAWRYHSLTAAGAPGWRVRRAAAVLRRHTLAGVEHLALGEDDRARDAVRRSLATLYQVTDGTAPAALADLAPWRAMAPPPVKSTITGPAAGPAASTAPAAAASGPPDQALTGLASDPLGRLDGRWTADVHPSNDDLSSVQGVQSAAPSDPPRRPDGAESPPPIGRPDGRELDTAPARPSSVDAVHAPAPLADPGAGAPPSTAPAAPVPAGPQPVLTTPAPPPEVDSASARAEWVARRYRDAHHTLPTTRDLSSLANVSTGTAGAALKALRDAPQIPSSTSNDRQQTSPPDNDSDQTQQHDQQDTDQTQTTHHEHPTHHTNKIQKSYTPMHHDPEEDQPRGAGASVGTTDDGPQEPPVGAEPAVRPAGEPVG